MLPGKEHMKGEKTVSILLLSHSRTSLGFGHVIDVAGKQIFPKESCVKKTQDLPSTGYLLQNGFVGLQSPEL